MMLKLEALWQKIKHSHIINVRLHTHTKPKKQLNMLYSSKFFR